MFTGLESFMAKVFEKSSPSMTAVGRDEMGGRGTAVQ